MLSKKALHSDWHSSRSTSSILPTSHVSMVPQPPLQVQCTVVLDLTLTSWSTACALLLYIYSLQAFCWSYLVPSITTA